MGFIIPLVMFGIPTEPYWHGTHCPDSERRPFRIQNYGRLLKTSLRQTAIALKM